MDEAALRAMMPMSFGKKAARKPAPKASQSQSQLESAHASSQDPYTPSSSLLSTPQQNGSDEAGSTLLGKRRAMNADADAAEEEKEDVDDGLTPEERAANLEAERKERERRARGLPSSSSSGSDSDSDSGSDDDIGPPPPELTESVSSARTTSPSIRTDVHLPPMDSHATFSGTHSKTVSALAVEASGARFALGSYDYSLSLYDFGGMSARLTPFRHFEPCGSYPLLELGFSRTGAHLLVVSGTSMAKVFTRDGAEVGECRKGDPYLRDMRHTHGHVSSLTCGQFHPSQPAQFLTGASDSTVRLWDVETMTSGQTATMVLKSQARGSGTRTKVTAIQATEQGTVVASGLDGSLSYWDLRVNVNSGPRGSIRNAHLPETWTSSIALHGDGHVLATRGGDTTVKLWDLRCFRTPLAQHNDLANTSPHTSIIFDPLNRTTLLTCTSARAQLQSELLVLDTTQLARIQTYRIPANQTGLRLAWSHITNQLFLTTRTSLLVFYTPHSSRGVLLPLSRPLSSPTSTSTSIESQVYDNPVAPAQSENAKRRKLAKARQDPTLTRLPQLPLAGPGRAGRIGAAATQHIVQSIYQPPQAAQLHDDPRQALLKYATPNQHTRRTDEPN